MFSYAGRHKAFKQLFAAPIPDELPLSDQPWFQQQFRATKVCAPALCVRNLRRRSSKHLRFCWLNNS